MIDYVNQVSSSAIIKPLNIHKIVSENINGIKKDFVMIELEEYNLKSSRFFHIISKMKTIFFSKNHIHKIKDKKKQYVVLVVLKKKNKKKKIKELITLIIVIFVKSPLLLIQMIYMYLI